MDVRFERSVIHNGQAYSAGQVADLDDVQARNLINNGVATQVGKTAKPSTTVETTAEAPAETTAEAYSEDDIEHVGGGWYETPDGERHKGKQAALEALDELNE